MNKSSKKKNPIHQQGLRFLFVFSLMTKLNIYIEVLIYRFSELLRER